MKIAYLAASNSVHTSRWVNALVKRGWTIFLITMHNVKEPLDPQVQLFHLPVPAPWGYFLNVRYLKKLLRQLQPTLLHVHYASGYGTLGRLSGFQPQILSVWGSDIFDFPTHSFLHRALLIKNLQGASQICSTSQALAKQTASLYKAHQPIVLTPFGVDTTLFYPCPKHRDDPFVRIGTVKTLAPQYGIDTLIHAFYNIHSILSERQPKLAQQLRLYIAGGGPQHLELQSLVKRLKLDSVTQFSGDIPHRHVPDYLNQLDIYVAVSRQESFGVAVLEASACGLPVVVSQVGGLPEIVEDKVTGFLVEKDHIEQLSSVLLELVTQPLLRECLGRAGRAFVEQKYRWENSVDRLEKVYHQFK